MFHNFSYFSTVLLARTQGQGRNNTDRRHDIQHIDTQHININHYDTRDDDTNHNDNGIK